MFAFYQKFARDLFKLYEFRTACLKIYGGHIHLTLWKRMRHNKIKKIIELH